MSLKIKLYLFSFVIISFSFITQSIVFSQITKNGDVYIAKTTINNPDSIKLAIKKWTKNKKEYNSNNKTCLLITSLNSCSSCSSTAINSWINEIQGQVTNVNFLIVVIAEDEGEGLALRKNFKSVIIAEDNNETIKRIFNINDHIDLPAIYLINSDGRIIYKVHDISHNPEGLQKTINILNNKNKDNVNIDNSNNSIIIPIKSTKLEENDTFKITNIETPFIYKNKKYFVFTEMKQNIICLYNIINGNLINVLKPDESISNRFKNRIKTVSDNEWRMIEEGGMHFTDFISIINIDENLLYVLSKNISNILVDTTDPNNRQITLNPTMCALKFLDNKFQDYTEIPSTIYAMYGGFLNLNDSEYTYLCYYLGEEKENKDSIFIFAKINKNFNKITPFISYKELNIPLQYNLSTNYIQGFTTGENKLFFYSNLDTSTNRCEVESNKEFVNFFKYTKKIISKTFSFADMMYNNKKIYITYVSKDEQNNTRFIQLESYSSKGEFIKKIKLSVGDDKLLSTQILDVNDKSIMLINKYKARRWQIETYNIE